MDPLQNGVNEIKPPSPPPQIPNNLQNSLAPLGVAQERVRTIPKINSPTPPSTLRSIRTYKSDVAESVQGEKTSLASMVIAEQNRKQDVYFETSPKNPKNIIFVVIGTTLILLGGGLIYFFMQKNTPSESLVPSVIVQALFFTEATKEISVTGLTANELSKKIAEEVRNATIRLDTLENIYFTETIQGVKTTLGSKRLFFFLDHRIPQVLLRSLNEAFLFGVHTFNGNNPFLVLTTNLYENSFTGMLSWERSLARDVLPLFGKDLAVGSPLFEKQFTDEIIRNLDARVLRDDRGKIIILYLFKDRGTIIITTSEDTLEEVIRRLNTSKATAR